MDDLLLYFEVTLIAFLVNVIPALVPPTWVMLSMFKIHNPELDTLWIAAFGVVGSILGRYVLYLYCRVLGKFVPRKYEENIHYISRFLGEKKLGVFIGTFLYALSPLPSNFLFISSGVSAVDVLPVLGGFALGRLISYASLIHASHRVIIFFDALGVANIRLAMDVLGLVGGIAVLFVDWRKVLEKLKLNSGRIEKE
jgi:membrane protein YqaA with SNARE-associated domain